MSKFVTIGEMVFPKHNVVRFQRATWTPQSDGSGLVGPHLFVWLTDGVGCSIHQPMICPDPDGDLFAKLQTAMTNSEG